jgi:hypothetical protein
MMTFRTGKPIALVHAAINGIEQLTAPQPGGLLQAGQSVLAKHFLAMLLLRTAPAPASFTGHLAWRCLPDVPPCALELMPHAAAPPRRFEASPAVRLRYTVELCKALGISAFGTRNPMLNDKRSAAYKLMPTATRERIAGLPIVPTGRQAGNSLRLCSMLQPVQERGCRLAFSDRGDKRRISRRIVELVYSANKR